MVEVGLEPDLLVLSPCSLMTYLCVEEKGQGDVGAGKGGREWSILADREILFLNRGETQECLTLEKEAWEHPKMQAGLGTCHSSPLPPEQSEPLAWYSGPIQEWQCGSVVKSSSLGL